MKKPLFYAFFIKFALLLAVISPVLKPWTVTNLDSGQIYSDIQTALDSASDGDILALADGIYTQNLICSGLTNITLTSVSFLNLTQRLAIWSNYSGTAISIDTSSNVTISGLEFTAGDTGISAGSEVTIIRDSVFDRLVLSGVSASASGSIIYNLFKDSQSNAVLSESGTLAVAHNTFFNSTACHLYLEGTESHVIHNNIFHSALAYAVYADQLSPAVLSHNIFYNNSTDTWNVSPGTDNSYSDPLLDTTVTFTLTNALSPAIDQGLLLSNINPVYLGYSADSGWQETVWFRDVYPPEVLLTDYLSLYSYGSSNLSLLFQDHRSGLASNSILVSIDGQPVYLSNTCIHGLWQSSVSAASNGLIISLSKTSPFTADSTIPVFVSASDQDGNWSNYSFLLEINNIYNDQSQPLLDMTAPAPGTTNASILPQISISMGDGQSWIDHVSIWAGVDGISVYSNGVTNPSWSAWFTTNVSNYVLHLQPLNNLLATEEYIVSAGAANLAGLKSSGWWSFTTESVETNFVTNIQEVNAPIVYNTVIKHAEEKVRLALRSTMDGVIGIDAYTVDGVKIRNIYNAFHTTTEILTVEWDLNNEEGDRVANGMYLIRVNLPGENTRILTVIKRN